MVGAGPFLGAVVLILRVRTLQRVTRCVGHDVDGFTRAQSPGDTKIEKRGMSEG